MTSTAVASAVTRIGTDEAIELLAAAVDRMGRDYTYNQTGPGNICRYANPGTPPTLGCIVGHALHDAGVPIDVLLTLAGPADEVRLIEHGVFLSYGARMVLEIAQRLQDGGISWGSALDAAAHMRDTLRGNGSQVSA